MDASAFHNTTDSPRDQYVCYITGTVTANANGGFNFVRPAHGLSYIPLIYVQWSETADFSTPRELLQNSGDAYSMAEPWIIRSSATNTYVEFYLQNWGTSAKTIYFRAWGFMPSNVSISTNRTAGVTGFSNFITNTDMNYLKLHSAGTVTVGTSSVSVPHNLGIYPTCMIWVLDVSGTSIEPLFTPYTYSAFGDDSPDVGLNNIVFNSLGFGSRVFHYRIYKDAIYG